MRIPVVGTRSVSTMFLAAAPSEPSSSWGGRPAVAYVFAGALAVVALYLVIRLLIWDRVNQETPNQEEPLLGESEEPSHERR